LRTAPEGGCHAVRPPPPPPDRRPARRPGRGQAVERMGSGRGAAPQAAAADAWRAGRKSYLPGPGRRCERFGCRAVDAFGASVPGRADPRLRDFGLVAAALYAVSAHLGWINAGGIAFFEALGFVVFLEAFALLITLVPIPPLDGFGILRPWLPYSVQASANRLGMTGILIVFLGLWYLPGASGAFWNAVTTISGIAGI